jgi:hypothetical protein
MYTYHISNIISYCSGSFNGYRNISWQFLAIFVSAFLVHEMAHKFLAQYYGSKAEFRTYMWDIVVTAISALP